MLKRINRQYTERNARDLKSICNYIQTCNFLNQSLDAFKNDSTLTPEEYGEVFENLTILQSLLNEVDFTGGKNA
ncbi:hypothetical protein [Lonepinella sp. MS14437]|uniref:hypothetical protein n=1 Tax=Lonepinella sp. MS14437 TaxID=3003620 RepID=UPI0036DC6B3A